MSGTEEILAALSAARFGVMSPPAWPVTTYRFHRRSANALFDLLRTSYPIIQDNDPRGSLQSLGLSPTFRAL